MAAPANTTSSPALRVVCAFPLSSNYGPGSRILYYILVAACVTFRKAEWLRNACLAAALVLPAISALQGLVLASMHVNGAVDMDIYGAFQFCSIGILAAPLTVRLSRTYFYDPGRNIIFLWTILILMGLVALCVEFFRVTPSPCTSDNFGNPILGGASKFPYGNANCSLTCSEQDGPFSRMRGGAAANVNVIPVPRILTFNASMLLSAGFCIPAVLSLIFTWDKILEINWKRQREAERLDEQISGANITVGEMKGINNVVRLFLSVIEIPLFGGVILTIIGIGEANFFSAQVRFDTEPMASIGQWSPIAGTCLAALGSLYLLWTVGEDQPQTSPAQDANSNFSHNSPGSERNLSPRRLSMQEHPPYRVVSNYAHDFHSMSPQSMARVSSNNALGIRSTSPQSMVRVPTITEPESERFPPFENEPETLDSQLNRVTTSRNKVREWFTSAANYMGNVAHHKFDVSEYNDEKSNRFPEIPGEGLRNPALERISTQYSQLRRENSRAASTYSPSIASNYGNEGSAASPPPRQESPRPETSPSRRPARRDTLEVPTPAHIHRRSESH